MTSPTPDPNLDALEERLDDLKEGIDETRRQAQEDHLLPGGHERTLADPDGDGVDE